MEYVYNNDAKTFGGYTSADINNKVADFSVALADDGTGTHFVQSSNYTLRYAGSYQVKFTYKIGTTKCEADYYGGEMPKFTVSSMTPTVKISGISPTGTLTVDTGNSGSGHKKNYVTAGFTDYSADVYFKGSQTLWVHNYEAPKVTISLSNWGTSGTAELSLGADSKVYSGTTQVGSFSWTDGATTCQRTIGLREGKSWSSDSKTVAGTITSQALKITYSGMICYFDTPTITINNPY